MEEQVKSILEKTEITNLLIRYFAAIDDKQLNEKIVGATFTSDAQIIKPNGAISAGHENILKDQLKSFARFKATHHATSDYIIDIENDTASIRTNLTAMHLWADNEENPFLNGKHFHAGGVLNTKAIKIEGKWKINEWIFRVVWRTGEGIHEMAKFARPKN